MRADLLAAELRRYEQRYEHDEDLPRHLWLARHTAEIVASRGRCYKTGKPAATRKEIQAHLRLLEPDDRINATELDQLRKAAHAW